MNPTSEPLVSIVTPVYNGEEYLVECIESVLAQTYQNWDYTIVNNFSTDRSMEIARQYAARDKRIRIHDNAEFLPVIANHNSALRQISADSKYCKLVFADDWIFPECIARMVAVAEEFPSVGIVGAYVLQGREVKCLGLPYQSVVFDGREICREHLLNELYVFESANAVLYRANLVRSKAPFYDESNIHADNEVCFKLLKNSDFGFVHQLLTYSRVRTESLRAASEDLQTGLAGNLQILRTSGPDFLNQSELDQLVQRHMAEYYQFLGKCLLRGRQKTLIYHRQKLSEVGAEFQWLRAIWGAFATIGRLISNPTALAQRLSKSKRAPVGHASSVSNRAQDVGVSVAVAGTNAETRK